MTHVNGLKVFLMLNDVDIVKRGPHQLIMNFPYNNTTPRRRFSSNHYKRVLYLMVKVFHGRG